jgi:hypothetical protein
MASCPRLVGSGGVRCSRLATTTRDRLCDGKQAGKVLRESNSGFLCDAVGIRANSQQKSPHVIPGLLILGPGTSTGLDVTSCRHFHSLRNTTPPQSKAIHRRKHRATEYVSGKIKFISYLPRWVGSLVPKMSLGSPKGMRRSLAAGGWIGRAASSAPRHGRGTHFGG